MLVFVVFLTRAALQGPPFDSYMANQIVEFVDRYSQARDIGSGDIAASAPTKNFDKIDSNPCLLSAD